MNIKNTDCRCLCEVRLSELGPSQLKDLTEFAKHRLSRLGLNTVGAEDVTQQALASILKGLGADKGGRIPRLGDVVDPESFLNYLRGIISSIAWNLAQRGEFRAQHISVDLIVSASDSNVADPAMKTDLNDLAELLFQQLTLRAPKRLHPTIDAWRDVFPFADRIPAVTQRKYAWEVRKLARKIFTELVEVKSCEV